MTHSDDFININESIKIKSTTNDILIFKNGILYTTYKRTNAYENDKIKNINENYKLNNTSVKIIELSSGIILQIGKYGFSIYNSFSEFIKKTKIKFVSSSKNFFFLSY